MGFPVGYSEIFIPTLFIHTLTFLTLFKKLLNTIFNYIGIPPECLEPDSIEIQDFHDPNQQPDPTTNPPLSALLLRELLPLSRVPLTRAGENCGVCLNEFSGGEETRCLLNCKHVFHRECLDRWIDLDHRNCPLCRTPFLRDGLLREFNQRLLFDCDRGHDYHGFNNLGMRVDGYYYHHAEFSS